MFKPLKRSPVNKHKSASTFRHHQGHVKAANLMVTPMRGGWRF